MNVERTVVGFLFGALIGNLVGFSFRFFARHPIISLMLAFVAYGLYQQGPGEQITIAREAEQTLKGTPSEEAVAEAEEKGEVIEPQPKVVLTRVTPVPSDRAPAYERPYSFDDVEVVIANGGDVDIQDIGLNCKVRKVGDDPGDPPHSFNADRVQFETVKAGESKALLFPFRGLRLTKLQPNSFQCTPFWTVNDASAVKAVGRQDLDLTSVVEVRLIPGQREVRYKGQTEMMVTVSGEVRNPTADRFVKGIRARCQSQIGDYMNRIEKDAVYLSFEVLPGQLHRFGPKDVAQYRNGNGHEPVSTTCRLEQVFEEKTEAREKRVKGEAAEAEKLSKMTALERKRYRAAKNTLWGRVSGLWK